MIYSKLYLLLALFFVFVICSTSTDEKPRKSDAVAGLRRKTSNYGKTDDRQKNTDKDKDQEKDKDQDKVKIENNDNEVDNDHLSSASYAHNRYSSYNSPESNYRPRSRVPASLPPMSSAVPASYDDLLHENEWSPSRSRWQGSSAAMSPSLPSSYDDYTNENDWPRSGYRNGYPAPSQPMLYDNEALLGGPKCHSLIDHQYPIISDTCGAVPQARYTLPNSFGHRDRWQAAQALTALMSASTDPACTRSLRLLVCPVLFPSCPTRYEPTPVLPCQSYCRAVKARCSTPTLDLLPCEVFPYSSDFCPTNQQYGSFLPQGAFPSASQPFSMPGGQQRSFPSLQSLLSLSGHQSPSPSAFNSLQSQSPLNLYNGGQYASDSFGSMLNDYPSRSYADDYASRSYANDYRQAPRYNIPMPRSSTETRSTADTRAANEARQAAPRSPIVKA